MLVLSRKVGEQLIIGDCVKIVVNRIAGNRVQIGIEAPPEVHIMRGELDHIRRQFSENNHSAPESFQAGVTVEFDTVTDLMPRAVH